MLDKFHKAAIEGWVVNTGRQLRSYIKSPQIVQAGKEQQAYLLTIVGPQPFFLLRIDKEAEVPLLVSLRISNPLLLIDV